jgi:hypothetical protein
MAGDDRMRLDRIVKRSYRVGIALLLVTAVLAIVELWLYSTWLCSTCPYGPHFTLIVFGSMLVVVFLVVYRSFFRRK